MELFPDAAPTLDALRQAGLRLATCSNLAAPYGAPAKRLLGEIDAHVFGYEVGLVKPDPGMHALLSQCLGCPPQEILMVGDRLEEDCLAPLAATGCAPCI